MATPMSLPTERLINELQTFGVRLADPKAGLESRRGGAGPSDHKALTIDGVTVMAPVHTAPAFESPTSIDEARRRGHEPHRCVTARRSARRLSSRGRASMTLTTADGVPYSKIAVLHGRDVLATTVLQTCIRYQSRTQGLPVLRHRPVARGGTHDRAQDAPPQLAEVAKAAVELDGVKHMVMTTGTPRGADRGAAILCESAAAVKAAVDLPIQAQCEPPDDDAWFERLKAAGVDALGMHLEAVTPEVRRRIMPGKAEVSVERYLQGFRGGGLGLRPRAGLDLHPRGPRRPGRGDPRDVRDAGSRSASIRSSCPSCRFPGRRSKAGRRPRRPSCTRCLRRSRRCWRPTA